MRPVECRSSPAKPLRILAHAIVLGIALLAMSGDRPAALALPAAAAPAAQPLHPIKIQDRLPIVTAALPDRDAGPSPPVILTAPFTSLDGTTLMHEGRRIRLAGIEGPSATETCLDTEGRRWSCGLQARAALHNMLAGQSLSCRAVSAEGHDAMTAECRLASSRGEPERDLAAVLVLAGWARPLQRDSLADEREAAQNRRFGLWRGGWTVHPSRP